MKLALVIAAIVVIAGAFFLGYKSGSNKQKVVYQTKIIESGERHARIEKEQSKDVATRGQRLHINRLHKGDF